MKKILFTLIALSGYFALTYSSATAALINGPDIITAPSSVVDDSPGAENDHMQGFNERQGVYISEDIYVDSGASLNGFTVDSHMIFLNTDGNTFASDRQTWTFDGLILGVMSDKKGKLEAASNHLLGALGTIYPGSFNARGLESGTNNDEYNIIGGGYQLEVYMRVTEPGDWIRVVTASPVPEPTTMLLFGTGIAGLAAISRRIRK